MTTQPDSRRRRRSSGDVTKEGGKKRNVDQTKIKIKTRTQKINTTTHTQAQTQTERESREREGGRERGRQLCQAGRQTRTETETGLISKARTKMMMTLCRRKVHNQQAATPPLKAATPRSLAPSSPSRSYFPVGAKNANFTHFHLLLSGRRRRAANLEAAGGVVASARQCHCTSACVCV